ncbi:MAG: Hsp70 family protein [Deltaproteobacteria bacterium]|jgi:molecular chaperone DnaK|nr:Hsp70 family protein [Deltaproteobacteria bacterium]
MPNYIGIDLGTTNSAICSYNGSVTRIWKSPEQNDVTPSVIYIDKRGKKYIGKRAYDSAPQNPDNAAMLFKRQMGTNTPIKIANETKSPEECSAEILKVIFGYLPEEIRNDPETGTVITVPAAFNQMQKEATMQASLMAGIGKVALMQEPVAAVMSVMRLNKLDGMFLIYDLGGGTLDIAIAESIGGRVNLLSHGGIAVCGGRDFDRILVDSIVYPWLIQHFNLPKDFRVQPSYKPLLRLAAWASERAKIELSSSEEVIISLTESETRMRDLKDKEIYFDIELSRNRYNQLIDELINDSISAARQTLTNAGISQGDLEKIVFIGGPTNYKPLRDKVSQELGIKANIDINPMTAVAEGASLFAESINWTTESRLRKESRGQITSGGNLNLTFKYISRTPSYKTKIVTQLLTMVQQGTEFQIDNVNSGWSSGRIPLTDKSAIEVSLPKPGENHFNVFVFDRLGHPIKLQHNKIVINRTAATIEAIPSSHSVGIEVLEKLGGSPILDYLIHTGDSLPKKGKKIFKAAESLKAGSLNSLNFKIWEGDIQDPITDNRPIGLLKISGKDFDRGVIPAGADLECEYEIRDSGQIILEVSVPCIGGTFHSGKNFYSRQEGQIDFTIATEIVKSEANETLERIHEIEKSIQDPKIFEALTKLNSALFLDNKENDIEKTQKAREDILVAKSILAQIRKEHLKEIRNIDLNKKIETFNNSVRKFAKPSEVNSFDNMVKVAQRSIDHNDNDFNIQTKEIDALIVTILWRQDWFVIAQFNILSKSPFSFSDRFQFDNLIRLGNEYLLKDEIDSLREVIIKLISIHIGGDNDGDMLELANIIRG